MNDDELDQRLRAAGERWRAEHELPEVQVPPRKRPAWVAPLAAAASVALLVGGAVAVAERLDDDRTDAPPADTVKEPRWHPDLPPGVRPADVPGAVPPVPQEVSYPAVEAGGTYTPRVTEAVGAPDCRADDVRLGLRPAGPGLMLLTLTAARDDVRCATGFRPVVQFLQDRKHVEVLEQDADPRPGDWPGSVLVMPGQRAVALSRWVGWCDGEGPSVDTVEVIETRWSTEVPLPERASCPVTDFEDDKLHLPSWSPEGFTFEPRKSFGPIRAQVVDRVAGPGGLPTWVVELTARRDVLLDTCPSWQVRKGDEETASWRLNCDGVPDHKADGRPFLPAGKPVRFAVWVPDGDSDAPLVWVLRTPEGSVSLLLSGGPPAPTGDLRRVSESEANLHLWLSNQSFDDPSVGLTVSIDGDQVLDKELRVEGQHNFVQFHFAVPAGEHQVVVTSDTGARLERTITVPERGDRWAAALFWTGEKDGQKDFLDWMFQDHPIGWA